MTYGPFAYDGTSPDMQTITGLIGNGATGVNVIVQDAAATPFISEFHYDNINPDVGEFIEITAPAGTDLSTYTLEVYDGTDGMLDASFPLVGTIIDDGSGCGTLTFDATALSSQYFEAGPEAYALVDAMGNVIEFISYEGTITATDGPALGMTSTDVGVMEDGSDAAGFSLQLTDGGWLGPLAESPNALNTGLSCNACSDNNTFNAPDCICSISSLVATPGACMPDGTFDLTITFDVSNPGASGMYNIDLGGTAYGPFAYAAGTAQSQTITAILGDATTSVSVTVTDADDTMCTMTIMYDEPDCPQPMCAISNIILTPSGCAADGTYSLDVTFDYENTASTNYVIIVDGVTYGPFAYDSTSPDMQTITGLMGDGSTGVNVIVQDASSVPFISEFHYEDDQSPDEGEFIEITAPAGTDLTGYSLVLYNGNNDMLYNTINLSGTMADDGSGCGALAFAADGIQNGAPDGIALVDAAGNVVEFISYEGTITAVDGPAMGLTSMDIGVSENTSTMLGQSLQLTDAGWVGPIAESPNALNADLSCNACAANNTFDAPDCSVPECGFSDLSILTTCNDDGTYNLDVTFTHNNPIGAAEVNINVEDNGTSLGMMTNVPTTGMSQTISFPNIAVGNATAGIVVNISDVAGISANPVFISEFHYDNINPDEGEFVEITAPAGTDLTGYSLAVYDGDGTVDDTTPLSGTVSDEGNGCGTIVFDSDFLGSSYFEVGVDGYVLVDPAGNVLEFISYEGTITAIDGPAIGLTSTDVGVSEDNTTPVGQSLQLTDAGWVGPIAATPNVVNTGLTCVPDGIRCDASISYTEPNCLPDLCSDLYIAGVISGPLSGNAPKAVQLCANTNISDLSSFGISVVPNGNGSNGGSSVDFIFPAVPLAAGECIWVADDDSIDSFDDWFGNGDDSCLPDYVTNVGINGDDAVELYCDANADGDFSDANVSDVFGDVDNTPGIWGYADGWAYANDTSPSPAFDPADWTYGDVAGEIINGGSDEPYPNPPNCETIMDCVILNVNASVACDGDDVVVTISFFEFLGSDNYTIIDTNTGMTLASGTASPITFTIPGPTTAMMLPIEIRDADDPMCTASTTVPVIPCPIRDDCMLSATAIPSACMGDFYELMVEVSYENTLSSEFTVTVDGITYGPYPYDGTSPDVVTISSPNLSGNGETGVVVSVQDLYSTPITSILSITEIHYSDAGDDENEFIEITGPAGIDLTGYNIYVYNGETGLVGGVIPLSGVLGDEGNGCGAIAIIMENLDIIVGLQNDVEGLALVDPFGNVIEFISYEGTFIAADGPAAGMLSMDIGVAEPDDGSEDESLQLTDAGWQAPMPATPGMINSNLSCPEPAGSVCETTTTFDEPACIICDELPIGTCDEPLFTFNNYMGEGFTDNPEATQLCSEHWTSFGLTAGNLNTGSFQVEGAFANGVTSGGVRDVGYYAYDNGSGDIAFWIQPESDATLNTTLKVCNTGMSTITNLQLAYDLLVLNDQNSSSNIILSYSTDGSNYFNTPLYDYTSPAAADATPSVSVNPQTGVLYGVNLMPGDCIFLRWTITSEDGLADEFGLDNITVCEVPPCADITVNAINSNPESCFNTADASISISAAGTGTLLYSIDGGLTFQLGNTFTNLAAGNYTVIIQLQDDATCVAGGGVVIPVSSMACFDDCSEIYISEYLESSTNKCIELYNPTPNTIDLAAAGYELKIYQDGATIPTNMLALTGTIAPGGTYILCNPFSSVTFDQPITGTTFNGNDAIVICKGSLVVDVFGEVGVDPGTSWPIGMGNSTESIILKRDESILSGNFNPAAPFDATQWVVCDVTDFSNIGTHSSGCITCDVSGDALVRNEFCAGNNDGAITIFASSATGFALEYAIDGGAYQASNQFTGLAPGTYTIMIRHTVLGDECVTNLTVTVEAGEQLIVDSVESTDETCPNYADGTITIEATFLSGDIEYSIDGGLTFLSSNLFSSLAAGTYPVVVRPVGGGVACEVSGGTITIAPGIDNELPSFTCPEDITLDTDPGVCNTLVTGIGLGAVIDNCDSNPSVTYVLTGATIGSGTGDASGTSFELGTTTITYTISDVNGNSTTCSFDITIEDNELPIINCPSDITIEVGRRCGTDPGEITWTTPVPSDNCTVTSLTSNFNSGDPFPQGTTIVQYIVTDNSGNQATCTFNVNVTRAIDVIDCTEGDCDPITMPTNEQQTQYNITCGEEFAFVDAGGLSQNYPDEVPASNLIIVCPDMPSMQSVEVLFQSFDVAEGDVLIAYDGNCVDPATIITAAGGNGDGSGASVADSPGGGWLQASCENETGCITFEFINNGDQIKGAGWKAEVTCNMREVDFACALNDNYYQVATCEEFDFSDDGLFLTPYYAEVLLPVPSFSICGEDAPVLIDANCAALEIEEFDTDGSLIACGDGTYVLTGATFVEIEFPVGVHNISFTGLPLDYDCTDINIPNNIYTDKTCSTKVTVVQPPLVCNDDVHVSVDQACSVVITPDLILEDPCTDAPNSGVFYTVELSEADLPLGFAALPILIGTTDEGYPIYDFSAVECGTYFNLSVTRNIPNRACIEGEPEFLEERCWGRILVEDKVKPTLVGGLEEVEVPCYADPGLTPDDLDDLVTDPYDYYSVVDNCSNTLNIGQWQELTYDCTDDSFEGFDPDGNGIADDILWDIMAVEFGEEARFKCYFRIIHAVDACGAVSQSFGIQRVCVVQPDIVAPQIEIEAECGTDLDPVAIYNTYIEDPEWYPEYATWIPNFDPTPLIINEGSDIDLAGVDDMYFTNVSGDEYPANPEHSACGYAIDWVDSREIELCEGGAYKIFRDWTVYNWCDGHLELIDLIPQVIKVNDSSAPTFVTNGLNWYQLNGATYGCTANLVLTPPTVSDACGETARVFASVTSIEEDGTIISQSPEVEITSGEDVTIPNVTIGLIVINLRAIDACGNEGNYTETALFFDDIAPVAICESEHYVSLSNNSCSVDVEAAVFDDGSYDNCGVVQFSVARMDADDDGDGFPEDDDFKSFVTFTDADLIDACEGRTRVVFRVNDLSAYDTNRDGVINADDNLDSDQFENTIDDNGINYNYCMVDVIVQERARPLCTSIDPLIVTCLDTINYTINNLNNLYWEYPDSALNIMTEMLLAGDFGDVPNIISCSPAELKVVEIDFSGYDEYCPDGTIVYYYEVTNECGGVSTRCSSSITSGKFINDWSMEFPRDRIFDCSDRFLRFRIRPPERFDRILDFNNGCDYITMQTDIDTLYSSGNACYELLYNYYFTNWCTWNPINMEPATVERPTRIITESFEEITLGFSDFYINTERDEGVERSIENDDIIISPLGMDGWNDLDDDYDGDDYNATRNGRDGDWVIAPESGIQDTTGIEIFYTISDFTDDTTRYVSAQQYGYWKYTQYQRVIDFTAPFVEVEPHDVFCTDATDTAGVAEESCTAPVTINFSVGDACAPEDLISVSYRLKPFGGAAIDDPFGTMTHLGDGNYSITGVYPIDADGGPTAHSFELELFDLCANSEITEIPFEVQDCKAPTAYCIFGLAADMMPTGEVELWASDFDAGSFDNCTDRDDIRLTFADPTLYPDSTSRTFRCSDGELGTVEVTLWAQDLAGNTSFCTTFVNIQADMGDLPCIEPNGAIIAGIIETEMGEGVEAVEINLSGNGDAMHMSATNGTYVHSGVEMGYDYTLTPHRDDNPLNGVSTLDLVLISRHILGLEALDSPYKLIAADVNNSATITTFDIVQLRKVILHIEESFVNNTSWRFVAKDYTFENPANPFAENFPELMNFNNLSESHLNANFVGIKIGDVNDSAVPNATILPEGRASNTPLPFQLDDVMLKAGNTYTIPVQAILKDVKGYQFTLEYDAATLELLDVTEGSAKMSNFGFLKDGIITMSWNDKANKEHAFSLQFAAEQDAKLSEVLKISSAYTKAEAYHNAVGVQEPVLAFNDFAKQVTQVELYQNTPNPFKSETVISFLLPSKMNTRLKIHDVDGKVIQRWETTYEAGYNEQKVNAKNLPSGVLYYTLETDDFTITKRMIVIK